MVPAIGFIETYLWLLIPMLLRYVLVASAVHGLFWGGQKLAPFAFRLARNKPQAEHLWREGRTALAASLIYALPATVLIHAYKEGGTALYLHAPQTLAGWLWLPGSLAVLLLTHDAYFYWTHRAMHHPRLYRATHQTHHISKQPTAFASFAFHPWEAIIAAWFVPALAFVVPIHFGVLLAYLTLATIWAVTNHAGWEIFPRSFLDGPVGRWLITARHHNLHHTKFQRNYGLYFRFWDKAMGTDDMSGDPMAAVRPASPG
ncbi:sterol desaturase family protein [Parvularcula lutaonensis]|uniref:Sterol desaturase family protein n=1 Tax=Parvularcula lutaonensis TaxID=491923 RepID=A0ABV7M942_9PROT|nr:sterol desaturase family protein [Parvularcula lutaonensis]GGY41402.1 sterol desaturase [Parvularcula lutaonensis]